MSKINIEKQANIWLKTGELKDSKLKFIENRDIFQNNLVKTTENFLQNDCLAEDDAYILSAIIGEIGNNSFDHNFGNWLKIRGIVLGYTFEDDYLKIVLADQGQGILKTLKKVKQELKNDEDALMVAFTEVVSGRAPESRGNGLKFVKQSIETKGMHLTFVSGQAQIDINEKMTIKENRDYIQGCLAIVTIKCNKK